MKYRTRLIDCLLFYLKWGKMLQHTIDHEIVIEGIGLHSGVNSKLTLKPLAANKGVVFEQKQGSITEEIKAQWSNVVDTRNCTCIGKQNGVKISTIEHLMAALYIRGIDNVLIQTDSRELPIMDGSAAYFYKKLISAGIKEQEEPRQYLKIKRDISFEDEKNNKIELKPYDKGLKIHFEIDFPSKIVGHQIFDSDITEDVFLSEIAPCRTFCEKYQVDYLQSIGLIKGGSLENAVVLDGDKVLNPEGLRHPHECVNHKVLDAIGDLYTSGYQIIGELKASRTGHYHNNELLKILFADQSNYELV